MTTSRRSRFRLNPALVIGAMAHGIIEKTIDPNTGGMIRPSQMHPIFEKHSKGKEPGCRMTWCRSQARCQCDCKRCEAQCRYRDLEAREDASGVVHLVHADGEERSFMPRAEYEKLVTFYLRAGMLDPTVRPMVGVKPV